VAILIDPGMGRRNLIGCLAEAEPEGFIAIPAAQSRSLAVAADVSQSPLQRDRRPALVFGTGLRWSSCGQLAAGSRQSAVGRAAGQERNPFANLQNRQSTINSQQSLDDPAAIIFTTGSTGPPKGVLFSHRNFDAQVDQIREFYDIRPGEIDVPCFPMFGLFNCAMGVTAVIPDMDPSRPAQVDPLKIIEAARDWGATQAFGSPAVWDRVGRYCESHGVGLPTIRRVLSAGAPIPAEVASPHEGLHPS